MNIWAWVEKLQDDLRAAGQGQSADSINRLTDHVSELEVERAEALLPEVKAINKTLANPWLDVFTRHWEMRNRLGNQMEGETALADAVSLFEAAHRDNTIDCPQSVCVTQDLATCYANIDGPGWVPERIEVCDETLARIDPSWACYQCLTVEKGEALLDAKRYDDVLTYMDEQEEKILAGGEEDFGGLAEVRIHALLAMDRPADALLLIESLEEKADGPEWKNTTQPRDLAKALAYAKLGRDEEAMALLPTYTDIAPRYRKNWLRIIYLLIQRAPQRNTWGLGSTIYRLIADYSRLGTHRLVIDLTEPAVRLAVQRGSAWSARRHMALALPHVDKLKADCGASALLDELSALIDAMPDQSLLPVPADQLLAWLEREDPDAAPRDPEVEVQWLLRALQQHPDDVGFLEYTAGALQACAAEAQGIALLWDYVGRHIDTEERLAYYLLNLLLDMGEYGQVERLIALYRPTVPVFAAWCQARAAERLQDWPAVESATLEVMALDDTRQGALELLARALMKQERFAEAAGYYRSLMDRVEDPGQVAWELMTAASCAEDWAVVRDIAQRLDIELTGNEGTVEEDWGWAIVRFIENGEAVDYYTRRTGPVTARIIENAHHKHTQHVGDWVVVEPAMLFAPPEDEQERERFVPTYLMIHILEKGGYGPSWLIDGVYAGDEAFGALREQIEARGWQMWVHSNPDYQLSDAEQHDQAPLVGLYFTVAIPAHQPASDLHNLLRTATAHWPHQLCWLHLAEHCQVDTQPHYQVIERYSL